MHWWATLLVLCCIVLSCLSLHLIDITHPEILYYAPKSDALFCPVLCSYLNFERTIGFWFLKYFRFRELLALVLWKKIRVKGPLVPVISKLFRTCSFCERTGKESVGFWLVTRFVQFLRMIFIFQRRFFRAMVIHPNNHSTLVFDLILSGILCVLSKFLSFYRRLKL
jgi:hypothetical protein